MFSELAMTVPEDSNDSEPTLCIQHLGVLERQISVSVSFEDIGTSLEDFNHQDIEIMFNSDSETIVCFQLISIDDLLEDNENFLAFLNTTDEDIDIVNGTALITIADSSTLEVGFTSTTLTVTEGGDVSACVAIFSGRLAPEVLLSLVVIPMDAQGKQKT